VVSATEWFTVATEVPVDMFIPFDFSTSIQWNQMVRTIELLCAFR
jgi:hypothetical protein